jgi:hypothetical protein
MPPKVSGTRVEGQASAGDHKDSGTSGKQGADYQVDSTRVAPKGGSSGEFDNSSEPKVKKGY